MKVLNLLPEIKVVESANAADFDGFLVLNKDFPASTDVHHHLERHLEVDCTKGIKIIPCCGVAGSRLIFSDCGKVSGDFDDTRCFFDAAFEGTKKAMAAGCKSLILALPKHPKFPNAGYVALMGALTALYTPLEVRESGGDTAQKKMCHMGVLSNDPRVKDDITKAEMLEAGRLVARDIGGSDPERMAAPMVAEYVMGLFPKDSGVTVEVVSGQERFEKEYPLFAAVNRAASVIDRHQGRIIKLTYTGQGYIDQTLMIVGKGVTYDTGGADVKAGGIMSGMHRDKCGAAAVAGFFQLLSLYKPTCLKVVGIMAMVRNSIGANCYVADEIITSRAGVRVRVGNTDAEGRMAMSDPLCELKEMSMKEANPMLFTWATLTGHVIRCFGTNYISVIDNGPAKEKGIGRKIVEAGNAYAEPGELTSLRREDFQIVAPPTEYEDVLQCNNLPSSATPRGHQFPAAFMIRAAGLDKHGGDSGCPLPYTHLDVAGSAGNYPKLPTGSPLAAMAQAYVFTRPSGAGCQLQEPKPCCPVVTKPNPCPVPGHQGGAACPIAGNQGGAAFLSGAAPKY